MFLQYLQVLRMSRPSRNSKDGGETGVEPSSMGASYEEVSDAAITEAKVEEELEKMITWVSD